MLGFIKGFLPWILYSIFKGNTTHSFIIAILITLAATVMVSWQEIKKGFILSWVTLIYFSLLAICVGLFQVEWLQRYSWFVSNVVLAGVAFGSYIVRVPFTIQYAKEQTPEASWKQPLFLQINDILTLVWGILFLLTAAVDFWHVRNPLFNRTIYTLVSNGSWVVGAFISKVFPPYWKKKKLGPQT